MKLILYQKGYSNLSVNNTSLIDYDKFIVKEDTTILETMHVLNQNAHGIVLVCDENRTIKGTVTDGDIRRQILKNDNLNIPVSYVANYNFLYVYNDNVDSADRIMIENKIKCIPVLDNNNRLVDLHFLGEKTIPRYSALNLPVVIMAGGKGTRLYPFTKVLPKPLIPIGDITITEHIMNRFIDYNCNNFYIIVNCKKSLIKSYFVEEKPQYKINFVDEDMPLGTGGGLKLLQQEIDTTFFMTNCDILISADYSKIYNYHKKNDNIITMVCVDKKFTIPYGTVNVEFDNKVVSLSEKPEVSFLTNTGMYIIEPDVFDLIPDETFIHITDIIEKCIKSCKKVGAYTISEDDWMDMGQFEELENMRKRLHMED